MCSHSGSRWHQGSSPDVWQRHCPPLQARGDAHFPYLDDWLIRSQSRGEALRESAFLISYATRLGLKINQEESSRLPSQQIVFSGIQLDSRLMVATPSQQRVNNTLKLISHFRRGRALALKSYLRLLGMLTAASSVVPLGLLSFAASSNSAERSWLAPHLSQAQAGQSHFQLPCKATPVERRDISHPRGLLGVHTFSQRSGGHRCFSGRVGSCMAMQDCQRSLESLAAGTTQMYWSCRLFCWRSNSFFPVGKHVLVGTANTSVVYQVDHQGSTRSRQSSRLTQQLWLLAYPQCICQGNAFARHSKHGRGFVIPAAPTSWEMEAASTSGGSNLAEIGQGRGGSLRLTDDDALSPLVFSGGIYKPLGPGCTGPCVAKSAAVRLPPTTTDPAHSGKDPQGEP